MTRKLLWAFSPKPLSEADVLGKERTDSTEHDSAAARLFRRENPEAPKGLDARTVGDAMSSPAITVEPHWPLASVAEQMVERGVNRLPRRPERAARGHRHTRRPGPRLCAI
jgi:CBS domain-containing protein